MRINSEWMECDDGIMRPVLRAEILAADDIWQSVEFLIDTGADRTVLSADVLAALGLPQFPSGDCLAGAGGALDTVSVRTQLRIRRDDGSPVVLRGEYAACTQSCAIDMSLLGRDIIDMFTLILDRQADQISLIRGQHSYSIISQ